MARIVCIGEGLIEISDAGGRDALRFGGDTLATAVHLARLGHDVAFLTALGEEPASHSLRAAWQREGLDCSLVLAHPSREAGFYAISTGPGGERQHSYWRKHSAARDLFTLPGSNAACEAATVCDLLHFSLESLAILPDEGRAALLELAGKARANGARVSFDGNYRPVLWRNQAEAAAMRDAAIALADIGLATWEDEMALSGPQTALEIAARWQALGCGEVVVKLGAYGCLLPGRSVLAPPERLDPRDTSGGGDAFDAGYLAARLRGEPASAAAEAAHQLAAWTIMRIGAIPPRDEAYPA